LAFLGDQEDRQEGSRSKAGGEEGQGCHQESGKGSVSNYFLILIVSGQQIYFGFSVNVP
jgi:hypothetical protein